MAFYEKDYQKSKALFEDSLLQDNKNFVTYYYLGEIAEKMLNIDTAINYFQKAIRFFKLILNFYKKK